MGELARVSFEEPKVFPVGGHAEFAEAFGAGHPGTDIFAARGSDVRAVVDGVIKHAVEKKGGKVVYLTASDKTQYFYGHLDGFNGDRLGPGETRKVKAGDVIGFVGSTGSAEGKDPHVHFEIRPRGGDKVNPFEFLTNAPRSIENHGDFPVATPKPEGWPTVPASPAKAGGGGLMLLGLAYLVLKGR